MFRNYFNLTLLVTILALIKTSYLMAEVPFPESVTGKHCTLAINYKYKVGNKIYRDKTNEAVAEISKTLMQKGYHPFQMKSENECLYNQTRNCEFILTATYDVGKRNPDPTFLSFIVGSINPSIYRSFYFEQNINDTLLPLMVGSKRDRIGITFPRVPHKKWLHKMIKIVPECINEN